MPKRTKEETAPRWGVVTILVRRDMTRPRPAKVDEVRNGAQTAVEQPARDVGQREWRQRCGVGFLA